MRENISIPRPARHYHETARVGKAVKDASDYFITVYLVLTVSGWRYPDDSFAFHHGYRIGLTEMCADPAADAKLRLPLSLFVFVKIGGSRVAFLDANAASDARIRVNDSQIIGCVGYGSNASGYRVAATASAAIADAGFFFRDIEIGMIGLVHQTIFLCFFQDTQRFLPGYHP